MGKKKSAMSDDERAVFERMKGWAEELDALLQLYTDQVQIPHRKLPEARAIYREIKEGLRADYKWGDTIRGEAALTPAERRWYQRTVHQASVALRAPVNSSPEKWFDGLYSAYGDFTHMLSQMESVYDVPKD